MPEFYAHSANEDGRCHGLVEHLRAVAMLARDFASSFGGGDAAYYAGLWHDLGKFNPEFQRYLTGDRQRGPDHKVAGTQLACKHLGPGGLTVQGHHGGLQEMKALPGWLTEKGANPAVAEALESAREAIPDLEPRGNIDLPEFVKHDRIKAELWVRDGLLRAGGCRLPRHRTAFQSREIRPSSERTESGATLGTLSDPSP